MKPLYSVRSCTMYIVALMFSIGLLGSQESSAQQTITMQVSVAMKDQTHPNFGQGSPMGYVIDGVQGKELTLVRGQHYTFRMNDVPSDHPFYISTSEVGAGEGVLDDDSIANQLISGDDALYFMPGANTPALLYYQCGNHPRMGWRINVVDGPVGSVNASVAANSIISLPAPNPTAATSDFSITLPTRQSVRITLHDMTGRQVELLHDGMLESGAPHPFRVDAVALAAGVYHVRVAGETFTARQSVVVMK